MSEDQSESLKEMMERLAELSGKDLTKISSELNEFYSSVHNLLTSDNLVLKFIAANLVEEFERKLDVELEESLHESDIDPESFNEALNQPGLKESPEWESFLSDLGGNAIRAEVHELVRSTKKIQAALEASAKPKKKKKKGNK